MVEYILGHDNHGHPLSSATGCEGVLTTAKDEGHGLDANIFGVVNATYTDGGGADGVPALASDDEAVLHTRTKQAEYFTDSQGVQVVAKDISEGGKQLGYIAAGDWFAFDRMNLAGIDSISARYSSGGSGGVLDVRDGAVDGPLLATLTLSPTGAWDTPARTQAVPVTDPGGTRTLYFVARSTTGATGDMFDVDSVTFTGRGAANNVAPVVGSVTATPATGDAPLDVAFAAQATDADGDALTYAWDFGDGGTATGATAQHTYTAAGSYTAKVTVSDPSGAHATGTVAVSVYGTLECTEPDPQRGPEDEFEGEALDGCRWDVVDLRPDLAQVRDGKWVVRTTDADFAGTGNQRVPNIITTDQPGDSWTVETKMTASFANQYQQGGLIVRASESDYVKLAVVQHPGGLRVELRSEIGDVVQSTNGDVLDIAKPVYGEYLLRLSRDGDSFTGSYSLDNGQTWVPTTRAVTHAGLGDAGVGVFALGKSAGANQIDVAFDHVREVDGSGVPVCEDVTASDTFDGSGSGLGLDPCRWYVVNADPSRLAVADGALQLTTTDDDVYGATNSTVPNIVSSKVVTGDEWTVETTVRADLTQNYHQGGLMVYKDQANYVKVGVIHNGGAAGTVGFELPQREGRRRAAAAAERRLAAARGGRDVPRASRPVRRHVRRLVVARRRAVDRACRRDERPARRDRGRAVRARQEPDPAHGRRVRGLRPRGRGGRAAARRHDRGPGPVPRRQGVRRGACDERRRRPGRRHADDAVRHQGVHRRPAGRLGVPVVRGPGDVRRGGRRGDRGDRRRPHVRGRRRVRRQAAADAVARTAGRGPVGDLPDRPSVVRGQARGRAMTTSECVSPPTT